MKEEALEGIGFSKNEAKVYIALLDIGRATATEIANMSKVHRTNVYDALNGLIKKGAVSCITKEDTKYYEAADPENLINILKEKEETLQKIIPQLKLSQKLAKSKGDVKMFEGVMAIKDLLNHFLEIGEERCVYGAPMIASRKIGESWLEEYHKRRAKKKIWIRQIYNEEAIERARRLNKMPYTEVRCLPKEYDSPVATTICGNEVVLMFWPEKGEPIFIQIINSDMAEAYKKYFKIMWEMAKKP
jgi:sugar-specific transcriptional regulator TrmB